MEEELERRGGFRGVSQASPAGKRISWGAIFAGLITAVSVQMLLSVLGMGVGAKAVDAGAEGSGIGLGAGIWVGISTLVALFCGGYVAGRLAGIPRKAESVLHGFLTWGLSVITVTVLLGSTVGSMIGGVASLAGNAAPSLGQAASSPNAQQQIEGRVNQLQSEIQQRGGPEGIAQQAADAGQKAAGPVAAGGFIGFAMLLLGACAAALGGLVSTPKNLILTSLPAWDRRKTSVGNYQ